MASDVLSGVNVKVQPRSGFDKSRKNILTTKVGTITPILSDLVIPNTDVSVRLAISASLPPLASETFMRASLKVEAFFCPMRLLYGGFESWLTGKEVYKYTSTALASRTAFRAELPCMEWDGSSSSDVALAGLGSLADYLGFQVHDTISTGANQIVRCNVFPFLAYHRIYDDWYRNTKIQLPVFTQPNESYTNNFAAASKVSARLRSVPYITFDSIYVFSPTSTLNDGISLGQLRQRNYGTDYFTVATPDAQKGAPMTVQTDANGLFSIAALRSANSIQQWEELQNLTGSRLQDYCRANYGAHLGSGVASRAVYLGSADYPVYSKGVYANQGVTATNNPFTSVGARYGSAFAQGTDFVVKAHFDEPGIFMIMATLVPEANYSGRVSALMQRFVAAGSLVDMPNPMLQNVGNEPIHMTELDPLLDFTDPTAIFGYVPRYTWHKTAVNEVHGLLQKSGTLSSFVSSREFRVQPQISSNFLRIQTTDLDNITAVSADLSNYGCWIDSYIQYYCSMPLAKYAVPSLQNPAYEHGVSVHLQNNGSKID